MGDGDGFNGVGDSVPMAEVMVSRMTLILFILQCKNVFYLYEQPGSSLLWYHPRMDKFISTINAFRAWTWMGAFGAESPKGTTLWSSRPAVQKLCRVLPQKNWSQVEMTKKKILENGKCSVSGGKDLKKSQAYTDEFGFSTLSVWLGEDEVPLPDVGNIVIPNLWEPITKQNRWEDARWTEVMQYLALN